MELSIKSEFKTLWLLSCAVFAVVISSPACYSQTDTVKKLKNVEISDKRPSATTVAPSQKLTSTAFMHYGDQNIAEAAANFAGVNVKDYGGIGGLKTVSIRSLGANHTGVLYDGIQLNDTQNGQIDLGKFSLYNIKDIALYNGQTPNLVQPARSFASSSLLTITTFQPNLTPDKPYQIITGVAAGSFGVLNPYLQWQQRLSNKWAMVLSASYMGANGRYRFKVAGDGSDTLALRRNSDIKARQTNGALYWTKSDSNKFKLQFNYYDSERGLPGPIIFYNANSRQRLQNQDLLIQSAYEYRSVTSVHLLISSKFSQNYLHYTDPDFLNNTGGINEHYTQHEFYQSVSAGYQVMKNWQWSYSSDAAIANMQSDVFRYAFPTRLTLLNNIATDWVTSRWHLQGNLLHSYISETVNSGTAASPRSVFSPTLTAAFKPLNGSSFYVRAFYKSVFRTPTFAEQYYYAVAPRTIRPEQVQQYNLGATFSKSWEGLLSEVSVTADAYYNYVKDKIIYLPTRSPETPSVTNLGKVDIRGIDVTFKSNWRVSSTCAAMLSANYTFQDAVDVTDPTDSYYLNQIPYTPKHLLNLNAGLDVSRVSVYYNYTLSSSRYYTSNNTIGYIVPGYHLSGLSLVYNPMLQKYPVTFSAQVNNLFDADYVIVRSYPMPGRSFRFSIQITI